MAFDNESFEEEENFAAMFAESEKKQALKTINNPRPVTGITHTIKPYQFHIDPSIVIDHTIKDTKGRIIAIPGTRINPFSYIHMSKHLVFIDGESKRQQQWALSMQEYYHGKIKIILTSGSPIDMMKKYKIRIYFDQQGRLSQKFHIHHVPSIVSQDGMSLRVSEIVPRKS